MAFNSIFFVFTFLPVVLLFYLILPHKFKNVYLTMISLVFYAWGEPYYVWLLIVIILLNYGMGIRIAKSIGKKRKRCLIEALIINVFLLFYVKYYGFVLHTIFHMLSISISYKVYPMPLGISFFTFSILAYLIDVYKHKTTYEKNIINFALYVSFFPKLIMGPISRYETFKRQFATHRISKRKLEKGATLFLSGLAQKVILANTLSSVWSYTSTQGVSGFGAWLGILAYTFQIYFDFQGYTLMALGLGKMFGFEMERNFNYPYMAVSITDFWHRWHMTLSSWFKDYVYIPLGGNRVTPHRHICNLLIVWLLTGLWHGASWNFILWGVYYGVLLIIEKYILHKVVKKVPLGIRWFITFICVMIGWVLFASNTMSDAIQYFEKMLFVHGVSGSDIAYIIQNYGVYLLLGAFFVTSYPKKMASVVVHYFKDSMWFMKPVFTAIVCLILLSYMISDTYQAFLYFKF